MKTTSIKQENDSLQRIKERKSELKQAEQLKQKEKLMHKAALIYQEVDYAQEWQLVYKAAVFLSWLANTYSFATGAFAMGWLAFLWLSGFLSFTVAATVALGLSFSLALCLELLKRITAKVTFKRFFKKKGALLLPFSALFGFIALSVGLSFYASLHIPSKLAKLPVLEDLSPIKTSFDGQIEELQNERDLYRQNRLYKNRLASKDALVVKQYNEDIKALRKQASATLELIKNSNQDRLSNWQAKNTGLGYILGYISLALEAIFLLAMAYQYRFIWDCFLDGSPSPTSPNTSKKKSTEELAEESSQDAAQRQSDNNSNNTINNCLTSLDKEDSTALEQTLDSLNLAKTDTKIIQIADNETIEEIRRIKDRLAKNWERAFTSKGLATRNRNLKQAKFWAQHLETEYCIQTKFNADTYKVNFLTLKTA